MKRNTATEPSTYEKQLLRIVHRLPPDRVAQVIEFAAFLESRLKSRDTEQQTGDETPEEIAADNARWDALLATDESQSLLEKLADQAERDIEAGKTSGMKFTEDGEIAPE